MTATTINTSTSDQIFIGGSSADSIIGGAGNDIIDAGGGADTLTGGAGADSFLIDSAASNVVVTDFSHAQGDKIDLVALRSFTGLGSLVTHAVQNGADTVIDLGGGGKLTLQNVQLSTLTASDFNFATTSYTPPDGSFFPTGGAQLLSGASTGPGALVFNNSNIFANLTTSGYIAVRDDTPGAIFTGVYGVGAPDHFLITTRAGSYFTVSAFGAGENAIGVYSNSAIPMHVTSAGTITVSAVGDATAMEGPSSYFSLTGAVAASSQAGAATALDGINDLTASAGSSVTATALAGTATGVHTVAAIDNGGAISATGATAYGAWIGAGAVTNNGSITASTVGGHSYGVVVDAGATATISNSGRITGGVAFTTANALHSDQAVSTLDLTNTGIITGDIALGAGSVSTIHNDGLINGNLVFGSGSVTLDSANGTIQGAVSFTGGTGTASLGAEDNTVLASGGVQTIDGGGGVNTLSFANATSGAVASLALQGQAQNTQSGGTDTVTHFQNLTGSAFSDTLTGDVNNNIIDGGSGGNDVLDGGSGGVDTVSFASALSGVAVSLALQGQAQNTGGGETDTLNHFQNLTGSAFNDTLSGDMGNNLIDGGAGIDTVIFGGLSRSYTTTIASATNTITVTGADVGTDTLVNVERAQFADGYLATGTTDTAAQVWRLYEAALGRAPDAAGQAYWTHAIDGGQSTLLAEANAFVTSPEFLTSYGALDNSGFVNQLYQNVLHRAPDSAGYTYWTNAIATGAETRAQMVVSFSESPENISDTASQVQHGLWVQDTAAAEIARLYDTVFGRLPDSAGEISWTKALDSGANTLLGATQSFIASPEFQQTYGSLDDSHFVQTLYQNSLHRGADDAGLNYWTGFIAQGHSRAEVVMAFSESTEHMANTSAHIDQGIWVTG